MKKIIFSLFALAIAISTPVRGEIIDSPDLEGLEKALEQVDEHTLVMFDVDETLITPKDCILKPTSRYASETLLRKLMSDPNLLPPGKYPPNHLLSKVYAVVEFDVLDQKLVQIVQDLQKKNIKTIAFTKMDPGPFGVISSCADWRVEQLRKHQFDFRPAFSHVPTGNTSVEPAKGFFQEGVLFCKRSTKGQVLLEFLKHVKWTPKKIVFLDDRHDYHQSVEQALEGTGVEYIGLHYTYGEDNSPDPDWKLAEFQYLHLILHEEWLSDQKARELITQIK